MPQIFEVQYRINKMLFDYRATITSSPQQLTDIFTISDSIKSQIKTIILTNLDASTPIYYGVNVSVSTSNAGGVIYPKQKMEISLLDLNYSPFFVAANISMAIEIWG